MSRAAVEHVVTPRETRNYSGKRRFLPTCSCGWIGIAAKTPGTAARVAARDHIDRLPKPCPTPRKRRFRTEDAAERALELFWRTSGKGKTMPCRTYRCPCGGWHTTAKPLRQRA
ncbi:hypothetical protein LV457_02810 [Mycobacterium sp. MYCO198283]|uniref:hypothetical protein n=1 Tax=Mycobacterium sp. MYCO198283 TaxID=2883505 RepID=UPI001E4A4D91|nr:hypothetical protein [Mycobacterium sp. MYCO198283]MCG5431220.1 hypothetical protein [Mycobacterium sp. MYCO198283]